MYNATKPFWGGDICSKWGGVYVVKGGVRIVVPFIYFVRRKGNMRHRGNYH